MKVCFATNNKNKLREIREILGDQFEVLGLEDIGCIADLPEESETLEENSRSKAKYVYDHFGISVFADDTGLEVDALSGAPGVYSARYAGPACDSEDNMARLLREMEGRENRTARFRTVITLILEGAEKQFEGIAEGIIIHEKKGPGGFGYDPVFRPVGKEVTFAEMPPNEKNAISHRGKAMKKLVDYLKKLEE